jgi:hypothetical protein
MDFKYELQIWSIIDPDISRENPVEDKHRRLVRGHRGGPLDRELKPDAKTRDELTVSQKLTMTLTVSGSLIALGYHQLSSHTTPWFRRQGSNMEIPVLPHS